MSVATSAIALPVVMSDDDTNTLFDIGFQSTKAEKAMDEGKSKLDTLDANLFDFLKGASYVVFMKMHEIVITGSVDAGRTADAAQKQWERQIGRISNNFTVEDANGVRVAYKKPVAESPDAKRKADARAKEIERLAVLDDDALSAKKTEQMALGTNQAANEIKKLNAEMTRRNVDVIDAQKAEIKALTDKINARVKELAKSGTPDAVELLTQAAMILG